MFLIGHAGAPGYVPHYCAEAAQLMSILAVSLKQESVGGSDGGEE